MLLSRTGLVLATADDASSAPFDVVVHNRRLRRPVGGVGVELRMGAPGRSGLAVVSTSTGEKVVPLAGVEDLSAVVGRLCRP